MDARARGTRGALDALALTVLRVGAGVVLAAHGWQKMQDFAAWRGTVEGLGLPMPELAARLAVVGELGGGIALALGLLTPIAALLAAIVMGTAIATVHVSNGLFAQDGGFEYPLVLGLVALYFVAHGGGPISVDGLVRRGVHRGEHRDSGPHPVGARAADARSVGRV